MGGSVAALAQCRDDERAYEVFEHSCAKEFAQSFQLYKLYAHAAAFAPLAQP